eukprot:12036470-Prorocentrum_lima.AAC.1
MHIQLLMAERGKTRSGVDVSKVKKCLQLRQQDLGMMREYLASELVVLEATIPTAKEMQTAMVTLE